MNLAPHTVALSSLLTQIKTASCKARHDEKELADLSALAGAFFAEALLLKNKIEAARGGWMEKHD